MTRRIVVALAGGTALAALLTACTGSPKPSSARGSAAPSAAPTTRSGAGAPRNGAARPAATGTAAAVSPRSMEVQNPSQGQVTVKYTGATVWSQTVPVARSAVKAGECVSAFGPASGSSPSTPATSFTARTVLVSQPVNGECTGAGAFGGGARPSGFPRGERPSGAPTRARRSGFPTGARPSGFPGAGGDRASGTVTAVSGATITVDGRARGGTESTYTVHVDASTTYTETAKATSAAAKVGECVTAFGSTDTTGAVTATRIDLSRPGPQGCATGFRRGGTGG